MKIAAADIGGTQIKYVLFDSSLPLEEQRYYKTDTPPTGHETVKKIAALFEEFGEFDAVSVCVCGIVSPKDGVVVACSNIPEFDGIGIKDIMEKKFSVPCFLLNDAHSAGIGEAHLGAGQQHSDFLILTIGTGIGGAIIIDKEPYYGSNFAAGEFGHFVLHPNGIKCNCSQNGCFEKYAATSALVRGVKERTGRDMNGVEIFEEYENNEDVRSAANEWMGQILTGLANLTHIFNPGVIVLGGGILQSNTVLSYLQTNFHSYLLPYYRNAEIERAVLGNNAGILGASVFAAEKLKSVL